MSPRIKYLRTLKRPERIPDEWKRLPQWVVWRHETRDGKQTKVPYRASEPTVRASSTKPATWASFEDALSAYRSHPLEGVGFVVSREDEYVGVDLDGCRQPETGDLDATAAAIIACLDSYTEISPSGRGLRVLLRGHLNGARNRGRLASGVGLELYDHGRFFTVTGDHLQGTPLTIEPREDALEAVCAEYLMIEKMMIEKTETIGTLGEAQPVAVNDHELLPRMFAARNGDKARRLWDGHTAGYGSRSEADLALCSILAFWTGNDVARIDAFFRRSGLMRAKWDSRRGDSTYGADTIEKAIGGETYESRPMNTSISSEVNASSPVANIEARWGTLEMIELKPIQFVDRPLFQASAFHLLVGAKNAGKGTFLSWLAGRITQGELGSGRRVIWIAAGEDSLSIDVAPRIIAAGGELGLVTYPRFYPVLPDDVDEIKRMAVGGDVGLIVLDPISGMFPSGGNSNSDNDVRTVLGPLNMLADEVQCLVVGVRHLGKNRAGGALAAVLGSVDWVNVPRAVLAIAVDNEDESVRHVQVVAGNRVPHGEASRSFRIVGVDVVEGGEPVTKAIMLEGIGKNVEDLLSEQKPPSRTAAAKRMLLDVLEECGEMESDALTARVVERSGLVAGTVKNAKTTLKDAGLIAFRPEKDEQGKVLSWHVRRTKAPRPEELAGRVVYPPPRHGLSLDTKSSDLE